jgi:hypothetical protein
VRPNLSAAHRVLAGAASQPVMNLYSFQPVAKGYFSAVFASAETTKNFSFADFQEVVQSAFGGRVSIVAGSLHDIETAHIPMHRMILECSAERIPASDAEKRGLTVVQANLFTDPSDNMWKMVGEGENRELMQLGGMDDFSAMLAKKQMRNRVTASVADSLEFDDGDYAKFFNPVTAEIDFGFVNNRTDGTYILARESGKLTRINDGCILEAACIEKVEGATKDSNNAVMASPSVWREAAIAADQFSMNAYLDYQRSLFGGTAFFTALENALRQAGRS